MLTFENFEKFINSAKSNFENASELNSKFGLNFVDSSFEKEYDALFNIILSENFTNEGIDLIEWWLFDDSKKIIYYKDEDNATEDVSDVEDLFYYIERNGLFK